MSCDCHAGSIRLHISFNPGEASLFPSEERAMAVGFKPAVFGCFGNVKFMTMLLNHCFNYFLSIKRLYKEYENVNKNSFENTANKSNYEWHLFSL